MWSDGYDRMLRHRRTMEAFDDFMAAAYEGAMIKVRRERGKQSVDTH